jgi:hypothetical protein
MVGEALPASATPATAAQEPGSTIPATGDKKSFVIQIVEQSAKSD